MNTRAPAIVSIGTKGAWRVAQFATAPRERFDGEACGRCSPKFQHPSGDAFRLKLVFLNLKFKDC